MINVGQQCILCNNCNVIVITTRKNLKIEKCQDCQLLTGTDLTDKRAGQAGAIETDPNHFEMLISDDEALKAIMADLLDRRLARIKKLFGAQPKTWLEIGPGAGLMSDLVTQRDGYWLGVEINNAMASHMQSRGKNVIEADFAGIDIPSMLPEHIRNAGGFDIIFLSQVFEHVTNPKGFLENALRSLRPDGIIYMDVPNNDGLTAWLRRVNPFARAYGEIVPPHHMISYKPFTLIFALQQAGFKDILTFTRPYNDPVFGLAHAHLWKSRKLKMAWWAAKIVGMGGNLTTIARKP